MSQEITTDVCPNCQSAWAKERNLYERSVGTDEQRSEWYVVCGRGHDFRLAEPLPRRGGEYGRYTIRVSELVNGPAIEAKEAEGDCVGCGEPIQPGQFYVPRPHVRHLGCVLR